MKFSWDKSIESKRNVTDILVMLAFLILALVSLFYSPWWSALAVSCLVLFNGLRSITASNYSDACVIELFDDYINYKSLNTNYSVDVKYEDISEVKLKNYKSQSLVIIELGPQFQLKCPNIEKPIELLNELNKRSAKV